MKLKAIIIASLIAMPSLASAYTVSVVNDWEDALDQASPGSTTTLATGASWVGAGPLVASGSVQASYKSPFKAYGGFTGNENYFTAGNGATYSGYENPAVLTFSDEIGQISFLWGSPDWYNTLELSLNGTVVLTLKGDTDLTLYGASESLSLQSAEASWITISASNLNEGFDAVSFYSDGQNAFEFANIVTADTYLTDVPLPASALLLLGGLGFLARRRRG